MSDQIDTTQTDSQTPEFDDGLPPGEHALEVAARAGFGPLSPLAQEAWHGQATPCVSCGQLVHRDDQSCEHCGQDLSEEMIQKMRQHAGPWFVLEHVRPFPGVSLERVIRQIRRGLITETSIVRGPSNDYQWRFAVETPGLCRYFGKCWCCHGAVTLSDAYCPHCLHYLSFEKPRPGAQVPGSPDGRSATEPSAALPATISVQHVAQAVAMGSPSPPAGAVIGNRPAAMVRPTTGSQSQIDNRQSTIPTAPQSPDLARLSAAVRQARVAHRDSEWDEPPRVGGVNVTWIAALLIVAAVIALILISRARSERPVHQTSPSLPTMTTPAPIPAGQVPPAPTTSPPLAPASPGQPASTQPSQLTPPPDTPPNKP